MPGKRISRSIAAPALLLLLATCQRPVVPFRVVLRAPPVLPDIVSTEAPSAVKLPRTPLLNRYEVVEQRPGKCPLEFHDYFGGSGASAPWWSTKEAEQQAIREISECTGVGDISMKEEGGTASTPVLSFVHVTDVQLRRATAKLGDERQSRGLDAIVPSFERDFEQELHLESILEALVKTVNETLKSPGKLVVPAFVMHGGDSIDAGLSSELKAFMRELDQLYVPWMDMIGNHDVLAFGNLLPGAKMSSKALLMGPDDDRLDGWRGWLLGAAVDADIETDPKLDLSQCAGCSDSLVASPGPAFQTGFIRPHCRPQKGLKLESGAPLSKCRGFDLGWSETKEDVLPGYYQFEIDVAKAGLSFKKILVVVLNTTDFGEFEGDSRMRGGEGGYIGAPQMKWLDGLLGYDPTTKRGNSLLTEEGGKMVLVFGHHPLATLRTDGRARELEERLHYLAEKRRLVGYFTGHRHRHHITLHCRQGKADKVEYEVDAECTQRGPRFWEIETASIISFPQEARWVTLRALGPAVGFIELIPFAHGAKMDEVDPFRRALLHGSQGAARDACRKSGCVRPRRTDGQHAAARLFIPLP